MATQTTTNTTNLVPPQSNQSTPIIPPIITHVQVFAKIDEILNRWNDQTTRDNAFRILENNFHHFHIMDIKQTKRSTILVALATVIFLIFFALFYTKTINLKSHHTLGVYVTGILSILGLLGSFAGSSVIDTKVTIYRGLKFKIDAQGQSVPVALGEEGLAKQFNDFKIAMSDANKRLTYSRWLKSQLHHIQLQPLKNGKQHPLNWQLLVTDYQFFEAYQECRIKRQNEMKQDRQQRILEAKDKLHNRLYEYGLYRVKPPPKQHRTPNPVQPTQPITPDTGYGLGL